MVRRDEPLPPRDSAPDLPDALDIVTRVGRGIEVIAARIPGRVGDVDGAHGDFTETLWEGVDADRLDLTGAAVSDTVFTEPRIGALVGREVRLRNVEIRGGRITTADLLRAELDGVTFRGVRVDYLGLPSARVGHVRFSSCSFGAVDLPDARLDRVAFEDCRADDVDTRGLRAAHLDLRGLEAASFTDPAALSGATLSPRQAEQHGPALAVALGIRVRDENA